MAQKNKTQGTVQGIVANLVIVETEGSVS